MLAATRSFWASMGAQSAGIGGGGGGTRPLNRLISLAFNDILGLGKSLAVLWLPWAALVWAFMLRWLWLGERGGEMQGTAAGARRGLRCGQFAAMRDPDGVPGVLYCSIDLRAPGQAWLRGLELLCSS